MIPYDAGELRMVIADEAGVVEDHIVHRPLAQLVRQPKIYEGEVEWRHAAPSEANARSFIPCRLRHVGLPCNVLG